MESAKITRAERRWVITELLSFFFFATGPEHGEDIGEEDNDNDEDGDGDDKDDGDDKYLGLEVEGQGKVVAYSSHCVPGLIIRSMSDS